VETPYASRIVCLSAEAVDILYRLGCGDRVVGVTSFAVEPAEARKKVCVSGFSSFNFERIDALGPDLVITFSDVQATAAQELIRRRHTVLATNQRSLAEVFQTILLIGRTVGREREAERLVNEMRAEIYRNSAARRDGPTVYFEEWDDPMISGIRWVSELIEAAGGRDIFPELHDRARAPDRVVTSEEVIRRQPEVIIASWCGKKANLDAIRQRAGWDSIPAVRNGRIHEVDSAHILQPGPVLIKGLRQLRAILGGN
jgi:iron complex transport system substrate-binding protein